MTDSKTNSRSGSLSPEGSSKTVHVDLVSDELPNEQPKLTVTFMNQEWIFSDESKCSYFCI